MHNSLNLQISPKDLMEKEIMVKTEFSQYLEKFYLNWQLEYGRASIREFSKWLDINHAMVIQWMNGNGKPGPKSIPKLSRKLGPEIYDIFDLPRPPKVIYDLVDNYDKIPESDREEFDADFDKWLSDWFHDHGLNRTKRKSARMLN